MHKKILFFSILICLLSVRILAQMGFTMYPSEYQIKAKYLYNLARFVDWPEHTFADSNSSYIIGILGKDPFGIDLEKTIEGKKINGRNFSVKRFKNYKNIQFSHILFINFTDPQKLDQAIKKIDNKFILTVGDAENFAHKGGILNFIIKDKKIRFQINLQAAKKSGIQISSKILRQAYIIENLSPEI